MEGFTDEERRALRGSKFASLPPSASFPSRSKPKPRLPHPGGPLTTNKAAALVKFLERKLQAANGLASIKPEPVELAVKNAKDTVNASGLTEPVFTPKLSIYWDVVVFVGGVLDLFPSYHLVFVWRFGGASYSGRIVRHVDSFGDYDVVYFCVPDSLEDGGEKIESKKHKKKNLKKKDKGKNKKQKSSKDTVDVVVKRPKKKLKL
ncbi:hypothetical protein TEA_027607 [Camellia sinensis var. sinensis]|uniref:Uncharacterized protein n=1 Tax=Camellia sinensis var. sinensis TaxID=542762 RepID=A0A4S4EWH6_CAMSN|nr:hypothetical protein TEA_027607 [Camellia sinensis var. sinensis]